MSFSKLKEPFLYCLLLQNIFSGFSSCPINICLRSTTDSNKLQLICKTDIIQFRVSFFDNFGNKFAFCLTPYPHPECHATNNKTNVEQYFNKSVTIVTMQRTIDQRSNGNWSCQHGNNVATVEINIPTNQVTRITSVSNGIPGWMILLGSTSVGYAISALIIFIVALFSCIYRCKTRKEFDCRFMVKVDEKLKGSKCGGSERFSINSMKSVVYMLSAILLLTGTILTGSLETVSFEGFYPFVTMGCIVGVISVILFMRVKGALTENNGGNTQQQGIELTEVNRPLMEEQQRNIDP